MQAANPLLGLAARPSFARAFTTCAVLTCASVLAAGAFQAADSASAARAGTASMHPAARASARTHLVESASLRLVGNGSSSLSERGQARGTFNAPLTAHLHLAPGKVTAAFTIYPKGGSISGAAIAHFIVKGSIGYYGGTMHITGGTGHYRHATGSNIPVSGTINHLTFALTVKANGWISL